MKLTNEIYEYTEIIFNIVREPLLLLDKDFKLVNANRSFYDFFKVTPDQSIGTYIYDLGNHSWDIPELRELLETILPERITADDYKIKLNFPDIGKCDLLLNARQIQIGAEKEKIVLLAFNNTTECRSNETDVKASEDEFRIITENSADAIFILNAEGRYTYVNDRAVRLLGYSKEEMLQLTIADISPKNRVGEYYDIFQRTLLEGSIFAELELIKKDGSIIPTDLNATLLPNGFIYGSCRDLTEYKLTEESLRVSHQLIEGIINSMPVRVFWKDKNLVYLGCNKLFAEDAGFTNPDEIIGKDDFQMGWHNQAELYRADDQKVIESSSARLHIEEPQTTPEGNTITLLTSKIPLVNSAKQTIGVLGTYIDISERKQAEEEIKKSHEELIKINAEKDKFFSIIAHDLKTPFNGFLNLTELMADTTEKFSLEEFAEYSKMLNKAARNLYMLLENLLEWAQVQKGTVSFTPGNSDLSKMVSQSIDTIYQRALQKRIEIINKINYPQNVYADEKSIGTVLRNLLSNAVKFTRMDGMVIVESKLLDDDTIEVAVVDNGVGISENNVNKLFKMEEKISSIGTDGELSTGLGLLLCKEFIEMHGGKIWAESKEDKGSTFYFTLRGKKLYETN